MKSTSSNISSNIIHMPFESWSKQQQVLQTAQTKCKVLCQAIFRKTGERAIKIQGLFSI
jgi:hypothetical protein